MSFVAVKYDFDIHWILPQDLFSDPKIGTELAQLGMNAEARGNYVALFRDPKTVAMLRGADEVTRRFFEACGFGLNVYDSGAGPGYYPEADEQARRDVVAQVTDNLDKYPLKNADLNGFEFARFLALLAMAKPVGPNHPKSQAAPQPEESFYRNPPSARGQTAAPRQDQTVIHTEQIPPSGQSGLSAGSKAVWGAVLLIGVSFIFMAGLQATKTNSVAGINTVSAN